MTIYIGVDFHARVQTVCWCDEADGEIHVRALDHRKDDVRGFYEQFQGEVVVGLEAGGYSRWFEDMLEDIGHQVWIGDPAEVRRQARRRQKSDRRDAELLLDLLLGGGFPRIHRPCMESREVMRMLRFRHRLVRMRTMVKNNLQAVAINAGLALKEKLYSQRGREQLLAAAMSPVMSQQRSEWLALLDELDGRIAPLEQWLTERAEADSRVSRLRTHPGVGLLTSLALVHTLEPVGRFSTSRKVVGYVGLDPRERQSAEKRRGLGISKQGSPLLRFLLVEAAQSAIGRDRDLNRFHRRLVYRRGPQKAKVAVARKLLVRSFIMLRDQIDYGTFLCRARRSSVGPEPQ